MNSTQSPHGIDRRFPGWYTIENVENFRPFLSSLASSSDHWLFLASNGGITAGRGSSAKALFPYLTEDKLVGLAHCNGTLSHLRLSLPNGSIKVWSPLNACVKAGPRSIHRKLDGTRMAMEEFNPHTGLRWTSEWSTSRKYGFVRTVTLENTADTSIEGHLFDGLQNVIPANLNESFQTQFGILGQAYSRSELLPESQLRLIYLNSIPTDRAEPSESLQANVVWFCGEAKGIHMISSLQADAFLSGKAVEPETETRGIAAGATVLFPFHLAAGEKLEFKWIAEVALSTGECADLNDWICSHTMEELDALVEQDVMASETALNRLTASADAQQFTGDPLRMARHRSNTLYNCMRGGIFPFSYDVPLEHFCAHLQSANRKVFENQRPLLESMDASDSERSALLAAAMASKDPAFQRLSMEFLPLTFSRRHGDPSRPWNKFAITVEDESGRPTLAYQGNWRDIFQNWESLLTSFPNYTDGVISRFLNASTADGYNPYRISDKGIDWEVLEPDDPWSNIGYWGDHQINYLLRLLEFARDSQPEQLNALLGMDCFAYANVPYRILPFDRVIQDPRNSIDFDDAEASAIASRVAQMGQDGKLLPARDGSVHHVGMIEKLLVPLFAKLANFVPCGGIWMNTQRPEWNDANNALAGYGLSVVTMAYCYRYVRFLMDWMKDPNFPASARLGEEVAEWAHRQKSVFANNVEDSSPESRYKMVRSLGESKDAYHALIYKSGFSGKQVEISARELEQFLENVSQWLLHSLKSNLRPDGLAHSYNLLRVAGEEQLEINHLDEMLEGQVAMLSSGTLSASESIGLLEALRASRLYRADQNSYLLYPDKELTGFLVKNTIRPDQVNAIPLAKALAEDPHAQLIQKDASGTCRFGPGFRNAAELRSQLNGLSGKWKELVEADGDRLCELMESIFNHHAFTGRSGTFFAYEGLGSIYWHMVSKLLLAVQEVYFTALGDSETTATDLNVLKSHYREILDGLGFHKSPEKYGAFPIDAYSHTPKHAGAQQPGMTGQVKEDLLIRLHELGVQFRGGAIVFQPDLLHPDELLKESAEFSFWSLEGELQSLPLPPKSLAFTLCQIPIILTHSAQKGIEILYSDGTSRSLPDLMIPSGITRTIFARQSRIQRIRVTLPIAD